MSKDSNKQKATRLKSWSIENSCYKNKKYLRHGLYLTFTKLLSLTLFASAVVLTGCQQDSSTDANDSIINDYASTSPESSMTLADKDSSTPASDSETNALNDDNTTIDTDVTSNSAARLLDLTHSQANNEKPMSAAQVTFHTRPLDYELPKQVAEKCVTKAKEGEIRCPEVNVALAEVEPKWIEQVINLDITDDNSPQRAKFYQDLDEFTTSQITDETPMSYYMQITPEQEASYNNVAQFSISRDTYMGGAHGMPTKYYLLFDMDLQSQIDLADVVIDDVAFYDLAYDAFRSYLQNDVGLTTQEEIADYEQFWTFVLPQSFYFNDTGVVLMYQPYEIGSYAQGFIELTVAYEDLQGILKPKYMS